jgi:two-component system, OmpR family, sensor histidine kinase KdpD
MKVTRDSPQIKLLRNCLLAMLTVVATTVPLFLIGRTTLGEGVIALLYLLPVTWSANRWGLIPGISAALTATLCFDFLFIPPFYTLSVGSLEGWLILVIFLGVAIVVVERIQASLTKAHETALMYELANVLNSKRTQEAAARTVAQYIQQLYQAALVNVIYWADKSSTKVVISQPTDGEGMGKPDRILPIQTTWGLIGEIQIWRGPYMELPPKDHHLLQNFAWQTARTFDRTAPLDAEQQVKILAAQAPE